MKAFVYAGVLALALSGAGCTDLASFAANTATAATTITPSEVQTYGDATAAADLATRTVDLAVQSGTLSRATLVELSSLNDALHAAWLELKAAKDANHSITYASFNAALAAFQSYRASAGVSEAPAVMPVTP